MARQREERPNVLFLLTDDQRFDTIRALGCEEVITPNLDRLVAGGTSFTRAAIMGGTSGAICMPSRAMMMTGRSLFHLDREGQDIPEAHVMMPEALRGSGYTTFGTGKWHNGRSAFARAFSTGDRVFFGGMSDHFEVPLNRFDPTGTYPQEGIYHASKCHSSDLFSGAAVDFLRDYDGEAPFFAYVAFTAPHDPRDTHPEFHAMYDAARLTLPDNFLPRHPFENGSIDIRDELLAPWPRTPEVVLQHLAEYYAMITHLDARIGDILDALEETGHAENTIVVFAGDNGLAVGQHGLMGKQNLYEHSVRVPLVFAGPGIPRGERRAQFAQLNDIYPTVFELLGVPIPASVESRSLVPCLNDSAEPLRETQLFAYRDFQRGVKNGRHKLISYNVDGIRTRQLFDLEQDPGETRNLVDEPECSETVDTLTREMERWRSEFDDPSTFWAQGQVSGSAESQDL